mgnify:CR=1 FL=1
MLEKQLADIGIEDKKTGDWEATPPVSEDSSDENDMADRFEDYEERTATMGALEPRLAEVDAALAKIESGDNSYGTCETCGADIEKERMDANPAAATCTLHLQ